MKITLEMGPQYAATCRRLGKLGPALARALSAGLESAAGIAAGNIARDYLSGSPLKSRSGTLRRALTGWMAGAHEAVVGIPDDSPAGRYAYLLSDEQVTIRPKRGKFLAIPIGENLTGSGVARFSSPRQRPDGFFVKTGGRLLFGYKRGKRGKFRALFTLVKSVLVQGTGALYDGVEANLDEMTAVIADRLKQVEGID